MKSRSVDVRRFDGRTGWCIALRRTLTERRAWKKSLRPRLMARNVAPELLS